MTYPKIHEEARISAQKHNAQCDLLSYFFLFRTFHLFNIIKVLLSDDIVLFGYLVLFDVVLIKQFCSKKEYFIFQYRKPTIFLFVYANKLYFAFAFMLTFLILSDCLRLDCQFYYFHYLSSPPKGYITHIY